MLLFAASLSSPANAGSIVLNFVGPGVGGTVNLIFGSSTDSKYPEAFEVTSVSGIFSDSNNGLNLINVPIGPLVGITYDIPEASNLLAPHDFSRFAVASGLGPENNGFLTYDNLYYPNGSPPTASDYPPHGGFLDIYGLMFNIPGGMVVDIWSNGDVTGTGAINYGVAVATHDTALDYVGGVAFIPEPNTVALLGSGMLGLLMWRRRVAHQRPR